MDFEALMSQEISKSKPKSGSNKPTSTSSTTTTAPAPAKYISRREAEEARRAAYLAEQKALEEARAGKAAAKRQREEEAAQEARARDDKRRRLAEESRARREAREAEEERARRKRLGLPELLPAAAGDGEGEAGDGEGEDLDGDLDGDDAGDVPEEELVAKLRGLGEPAVLFGESHAARLRRYRKAVRGGALAAAAGPIATTLLPVEEKDMKVPDTVPPASDKKARRLLFRQLASYFNMILREWELALAREDNAETFAGQAAHSAMISSKETMRPLFRKFEQGDLDESILEAVIEIVKAAQERRYVDANDGYLRLSIGKAAWPIGVTMVGIHERSAREKLHGGERGHIMGSEVTRKYLQSIKRCLTFAQVRWPSEDVRQLMG
ncbi:Prp18 domain-containing protein [Chaetomium fimeti]|uniref:Pre-mRNA-splicing factor 18 n=1 Tax=Chaetomium fimeti TaxID=1854472 RepID=A0AAE0HG09_9PEZI|nr:Prp18 domain-containing protein [Chaetomium fimeti]